MELAYLCNVQGRGHVGGEWMLQTPCHELQFQTSVVYWINDPKSTPKIQQGLVLRRRSEMQKV